MNKAVRKFSFLPFLIVAFWSDVALAEYPERAIKLVIGFAAGGPSDSAGRAMAQALSERLKQPVVVESKPGASTIVATEAVKVAPPDGHTLLMATATTFVYNALIYKSLPYAAADFEPIGLFGSSALALLVGNSVTAKTLGQLLDEIRGSPSPLPYGSLGVGSSTQFCAEVLWSEAKVKLTHVPYNGSGAMLAALAGRHIPITFDTALGAATAKRTGQARVIAITSKERSVLLPDVPTIAESGFPSYNLTSWFAIIAPRGLPTAVASRLRRVLADAVADKTVQQRLIAAGLDPKYGPPEEFLAAIREDTEKLRPIAVANNIRAE